jgi:plastocyanin
VLTLAIREAIQGLLADAGSTTRGSLNAGLLTFQPEEYPFYCRMHSKMTGKIIVRP